MVKLKLKKGQSYRAGKVYATKKNPICLVSEEDAEKALASGYFEKVETVIEEVADVEVAEVDVSSLSGAECKAFANEHGIDLGGATKVADMRKAIKEALLPSVDADADEELEPDMDEE